MPEKPEVIPTEAEAAAVLQQVVARVIEALSNELGYPLKATVDLVRDGETVESIGELQSTLSGHPQAGRVHVRFRPTGADHRRLFFVDSVFDEDQRSKSFGGFVVRGEVSWNNGAFVANFGPWSTKRNDRDWSKWL